MKFNKFIFFVVDNAENYIIDLRLGGHMKKQLNDERRVPSTCLEPLNLQLRASIVLELELLSPSNAF